MSITTKKIVAIALSAATAVTFAGGIMVASAQTVDINSLMAQIQALQAQIAKLQGSSTAAVSTTFTRDLTVGSKGADVSALQQILINKGYLTAVSAPTGYFGAATKAAVSAWQAASGITPTAGYFGSKSRAVLAASMASTTSTTTTTTTTTGGTTTTTGTTVTTATGGVNVSLASDNPVAQNIPTGTAELVPVLKLNFSAGAGDAIVTGLNVNRSGLSQDQDLQNVYLMDGNNVVATNLGITNGIINFSASNGLFMVKAGTTKEITVATSLVTGSSSHTYLFSIAGASSVTTSGTVSGNFPVTGNTLTASTVAQLGGIQITDASPALTTPGLSVNAGQTNFQVGQFSILAQNQAMQIKSIKFTNTGSIAQTDVTNFKLYNGSTLLGTVANLNGNVALFDLSNNPLQLTSGQNIVLYVYADILGGVQRNFQLSVQHNYDVIAQDMMFNIGVLPTLNTGSFPMNLSYVSIQQGTLTVNRDVNSPVNYVLPGGTNQVVAKFDFQAAGEAVRITNLTVNLSASGIVAANITNLKVQDDQGQQIGTTQATISALTGAAVYSNMNYLIPANTTRVVSVYLDLASSVTGTLQASVASISGQGYTSLASVTSGGQSGNTLTANSTVLSVNQNTALTNVKLVAGVNNQKIASFSLVAGAASGVTVSNVSLQLQTGSATSFQNLAVYNGSTQMGQTYGSLTDGTTYNFTATSPYSIPAGGQLNLDVYANALTSASSTYNQAVVTLSGVSATVVSTNQAITGVPASPQAGQTVSVVGAGTLSYGAYNMPSAAQVGMGTSGVKLATYQLVGSSNEAINVTNVYLQSSTTLSSLFSNFRLMVGSQQYGGQLNLTGSTNPYSLTFTGVNLPVAVSGNVYVDVLADANSYGALSSVYNSLTSAPTSTIRINQIDYTGVSSSQTSSATSTAWSNQFSVLRTTLSAAQATGVTYGGAYSNYLVGAYTFTAGAGNGVTLSSIDLGALINNASATPTTTTFSVFDPVLGQTVGTNAAQKVAGTNAGVTSTISLASEVIPAGGSKTLQIYANVNSFTTKPASSNSSITAQVNLTSWAWSDGTVNSTPNPTYNLPTNAIPGSVNPVVIVQ